IVVSDVLRYRAAHRPDPHSFPTRRSSDLEIFPALDGNALVNASSPTGLIHTILHGAELPSTAQRPARLRMQGYAWRLNDDEVARSEEHTSELQSRENLVCRLLLEKKKQTD